jgi:hypothetical protein
MVEPPSFLSAWLVVNSGNIEVPKCVLGKSFNKEISDKLVLVHLLV